MILGGNNGVMTQRKPFPVLCRPESYPLGALSVCPQITAVERRARNLLAEALCAQMRKEGLGEGRICQWSHRCLTLFNRKTQMKTQVSCHSNQ